jgi:hypothetical protein
MPDIAGAPRGERVADIFISYTSSDRDWAFWIAKELEAFGHTPHVHEWEIIGGDDICAWMERDTTPPTTWLCVVSDEYLKASKFYSQLERRAALWQAAGNRPGLRCSLSSAHANCRRSATTSAAASCLACRKGRHAFREFMARPAPPDSATLPGRVFAVSNIPIRVPEHFMGREDALAVIEAALGRDEGASRDHGIAWATRCRQDEIGGGLCRAASRRPPGHMVDPGADRADHARRSRCARRATRLGRRGRQGGSGVRFAVMERLRHEGEGILLIFDNALDADALKRYLPRGGSARVLVTSNAHAWRGVAAPVEICLWPKEIGADYLIADRSPRGARSGRGLVGGIGRPAARP